MKILLFDHPEIWTSLQPITFTRPVATIRCGIYTLAEKWVHFLKQPVSYSTIDYLSEKYPSELADDNLLINGAVLANEDLTNKINQLQIGDGLAAQGYLIAVRLDKTNTEKLIKSGFSIDELKGLKESAEKLIQHTWDIFHNNGDQIRSDFSLITHGRKSQPIDDTYTMVYAQDNVFIEEGVKIKAAVLNAENGPIYLGKNSEVYEGALIRGPFALGEGSVVNMGAKIRGDSTFGPHCKVGGEVANSVIMGYSNKAHDGYMGNSVIGEWCNLGADTNTSNLKNNYQPVKVWNYAKDRFINTGLQFCGLTMGDHSKCGINTMFNTGTVVGVSANIFGSGFPRALIPSFAWGGAAGFTTFGLKQALDVAEAVMKRRSLVLEEVDKTILKHIYDVSAKNRVWEKFGGN